VIAIAWCADGAALAARAADAVRGALKQAPGGLIALPTGRSPVGLYAELVRRADTGDVDFSQARIVNLDEYAGLGHDHPLSYAHYLKDRLLKPAHVPPEHVRLLRGDANDLGAECRDVDAWIERQGGIELAVLGLGENGHIAFNEPGASWDSGARVVRLAQHTVATHRQLAGVPMPERGLTLGVGQLRAARRVLLLVSGLAKRAALAALIRGAPDASWPVTSLADHPGLTVLADAALNPSP
jgi:glucosamine-6-phosphate deaminase